MIPKRFGIVTENMAQPNGEDQVFPFQQLPQEIRTSILRAAMPQHYVPPGRSKYADPMDYFEETEPISMNLLLVSKAFSAEVQRIIQQHVTFLIEVVAVDPHTTPTTFPYICTSMNFHYLHPWFGLNYNGIFPKPLIRSQISLLPKMRNFEIAPLSDRRYTWWFAKAPWMHEGAPDPRLVEDCAEYKEQVRFICDTLLACDVNIQHLSIRLPCLCDLESSEIALARPYLMELLAPIRRLRAHYPTTFKVIHGDYRPSSCAWGITHDDVKADSILRGLEASFGDLVGEELSTEEKMWKEIKAIERANKEPAASIIDKGLRDLFWYCFCQPSVDPIGFMVRAAELKEILLYMLATEKQSEKL
ncbi:MAG: hypothetical protein Q9205_006487 [Flavoplaca limonia]